MDLLLYIMCGSILFYHVLKSTQYLSIFHLMSFLLFAKYIFRCNNIKKKKQLPYLHVILCLNPFLFFLIKKAASLRITLTSTICSFEIK